MSPVSRVTSRPSSRNATTASALVGLILLAIYALFFGDMGSAIDFLFVPDFSKIDGTVVAMAVGQAFFSVGVGFGTMVSFGSYLDDDVSIASTAGIIVAADTAVALIAGLIIFPFVFRYGLEVTSGPGLVFETLPVAIGAMPAGQLVGVVNRAHDLDASLPDLDACYLLRLQRERISEGLIPSIREYAADFGLDARRASRLPDDALILHPGPTNLGVELTSEVAADHRSLILDQVANGVSLRMAVLFLLLGSGRDLVPDGVRDELPDEEAPGP